MFEIYLSNAALKTLKNFDRRIADKAKKALITLKNSPSASWIFRILKTENAPGKRPTNLIPEFLHRDASFFVPRSCGRSNMANATYRMRGAERGFKDVIATAPG